MAATRIIEGATFGRAAGGDGYRATIPYQVTDLPVTGAPSLRNILFAPGVPRMGDRLDFESSIQVVDYEVGEVGTETAVVTVIYGKPPVGSTSEPDEEGGLLEWGGSLSQVETERDYAGNPMVVEYRVDDNSEQAQDDQPFRADKLIPHPVIRYSRVEDDSPALKSTFYTGTMNSADFVRSGDRFKWLCYPITGVSLGEDGWQVNYEFHYRDETWLQLGVWVDPETGRPPKDVEFPDISQVATLPPQAEANGAKWFQIYTAREFRALNLPFAVASR